ncbi:class I SAM-dependent methyltransferase, partial [Haloarcula sp. AONF1]
ICGVIDNTRRTATNILINIDNIEFIHLLIMPATRLSDLNVDPDTISTEFSHLDHMYTGRFSEYYYKRFDQALDAAGSKNGTALEIGGGTGIFLLSLKNMYSEVFFSDISRENPLFTTPKKLFELSGISTMNVNFTAADVTNLPYRSESFNSVFVLDVLEHVPDERSAIKEIARVTADRGTVVVSAPIEVGIPVLIREGYRFLDGDRRHTESLGELWNAFVGNPIFETNEGHRGYDYRQTVSWMREDFNEVSIEYCPWPKLGGSFNPTAIISATM